MCQTIFRSTPKIGMNKYISHISHARDISPGYATRQGVSIRRQMSNALADHLEVPNHGVDGLLVRLKLIESQTLDVALDSGDGFENVLDPQPPFPRRQPLPRRGSC